MIEFHEDMNEGEDSDVLKVMKKSFKVPKKLKLLSSSEISLPKHFEEAVKPRKKSEAEIAKETEDHNLKVKKMRLQKQDDSDDSSSDDEGDDNKKSNLPDDVLKCCLVEIPGVK